MIESRHCFVYKTTNLINGKIYVGQHKTKIIDEGYLGSGIALWNAIRKYGMSNFKREVLEYCTDETINDREEYWIGELKARDRMIGYNIAHGGYKAFKGFKHSDETKKKLSEILSGRKMGDSTKKKHADVLSPLMAFNGCSHTEESKQKISKSLTGRKLTEDHKRKLSEAAKRNKLRHEFQV